MGSGKQQQACLGCTRKCLEIHGKKDFPLPLSPPSFFKIMIGDFSEKLFIPPKFEHWMQNFVNQYIYLENAYGNCWKVKVSMLDNSLAFCHGWKEFVTHHSIKIGEFVVFQYVCHSHFVVKIFGISSCERSLFSEKNDGNVHKRKMTNVEHSIELPTSLHNVGKNDESSKEKGCTSGRYSLSKEKGSSLFRYHNCSTRTHIPASKYVAKDKCENLDELEKSCCHDGRNDILTGTPVEKSFHHDLPMTVNKEHHPTCIATGDSQGPNLSRQMSIDRDSNIRRSESASIEKFMENENGCSVTSDLSLITQPLIVERSTVGSRRVPLNINDETSMGKQGELTRQDIDLWRCGMTDGKINSGVAEAKSSHSGESFSIAQSTPAVEFSDYDVQYCIVRATPKFLLAEDGICYIVYEKSMGEHPHTDNEWLGSSGNYTDSIFRTPDALCVDNAPQSVDNTTECYGCYIDIGDTFKVGSKELGEKVNICSKENIWEPVKTETMSRIVNFSPSDAISKHPHTGNGWLGSSGSNPDIIFKTPEATCVGNATQSTDNTTEYHGRHTDIGSSLKAGIADSKENEKVNHCSKENAFKLMKSETMDVILDPSSSPANFSLSVTISSEPWLVFKERLPLAEGKRSAFWNLKRERKVVVLCDPAARLWPALYHESNKFTGIHASWKDFAAANNIQEGDVCTFERAGQSDFMFQVHISKAQR